MQGSSSGRSDPRPPDSRGVGSPSGFLRHLKSTGFSANSANPLMEKSMHSAGLGFLLALVVVGLAFLIYQFTLLVTEVFYALPL